ncbi:cell wall-binding repeat-containing protein [Microbacterium gallinarum]|uniref:Cell wall-binding repeat-containing protein n=1 Tax=Microbacterium gallinarum TaxID=2762209 RepID=A0ABR8X515_9MICO|nr:cell wall-binding repeat-containing protein [Microbacterium gallinarum]MBD8024413.1 cell wall-binding repeat-containing protein [Microbacterium gallinarum]
MTPVLARLRRGTIGATAAVALIVPLGLVVAQPAMAAPEPPPPVQKLIADGESAVRISGPDRYETAARMSLEFGETDVVHVASGAAFPDALSAQLPPSSAPTEDVLPGGLWPASHVGGGGAPTLLTRRDSLPPATAAALWTLAPTTIRIIGGEAAVSASVARQLSGYGTVERIGGADRYETSALVAAEFPTNLPIVFVATGEAFPDALAGSAAAARAQAPILLTRSTTLPAVTAAALESLAPRSVVVLGGTGAVSDAVLAAIAAIVPHTTRIGGADRYETAAAIARAYERDTSPLLATGQTFPDALAGGALAGHLGAPLLLTQTGSLPAATTATLERLSPQGISILGGTGAVSQAVQNAVNAQQPRWFDETVAQILSFNDYHGHLEAVDGAVLTPAQDPDQNLVGGVEYLSTTLAGLRTTSYADRTITVAAGDLIGGSPFLSGLFQDEPSVESLNHIGLDVSSVGNHEFDEGTEELLRMQNGGCHPEKGCFFPDEPYAGADFSWLAANVVNRAGGGTLLPGTSVRDLGGIQVGFIGMTLEATPTLVAPGGVTSVEFLDEIDTANAAAVELQAAGVEAIVVLLHEGGSQPGSYNGCDGISGPIVAIAEGLDPAIDMMVTGHTHMPYICNVPDPDGNSRYVTSANQYGRVVTDTSLVLSQSTGDVVRDRVTSENNLVLRAAADPGATAIIDKWSALSDVVGGEVVGTIAEDITGDSSGDRGIETPLGNLVADALLAGTSAPEDGGAQISFMNIGGIRANLQFGAQSHSEQPGEITYAEAFAVAPFGSILVTLDLTGQQIKDVLEQQYIPTRGRQFLHLATSGGLTYSWDKSAPQGQQISDLVFNGAPLDLAATYRVSTLNFLAEGGDSFTAFTDGTNLVGGPEDLANLVAFFAANPGLAAPATDRVNEVAPAPVP